ncbi:N-acetyl-gamma-glutamyl-phosphate reductase [Candidatus Omnitrophus magneticus]|uniref:N-acetyl-gamma-glutamyl-phosphate reductase n=1 Tax=Candidatus Omnitrophus magneticus TaxID=1609969 RepID=A0A0F0CNZ3_9BACT|nr:N-acetyl-gamma-glutamyl-phosphate reductase [Candidatus Omnitrophus magneticus]
MCLLFRLYFLARRMHLSWVKSALVLWRNIMIKVGIAGITGYTGEELIRCLYQHPKVKISSLYARIEKPIHFSSIAPRFNKKIDLMCEPLNAEHMGDNCDIVFLALPHTVSMEFVPFLLKKGKRVIDLSADYRIPKDSYELWYKHEHTDSENLTQAVYGLPEINREKIKGAKLLSNPGCYPTSIILGLAPISKLISQCLIEPIIDSKSGTSGAGKKAEASFLFTEVDENLRCYKANEHQHIPEIEHFLSYEAGANIKVHFSPHLLPVRRGIMSTIYLNHESFSSIENIQKMYNDFYKNEPFVRVRPLGKFPEILDVAETNYCDIGIKFARGMLIIVSVIDNLLKGASGQAVQNMNIMCGFDEKEGLF